MTAPEIPSFFDPAVQDDPFEAYELMHEHCPVHQLPENGLFMVTKYDDVKSVLTDADTFSSNPVGRTPHVSEAAKAVGLNPGSTLRLVVLPQALRVIIPPITSQYLNLTKNSSLAIAIGYPDLVAVGNTALNQSGQAIEIIAVFMTVYLSLSLITSLFMNWYNGRIALTER